MDKRFFTNLGNDIKKATGSQIRAVHFNDHGDLVAAKA